jgi:hypothetical protein
VGHFDDTAAAAALRLLLPEEEWIRRRAEEVALIDQNTVRREITIIFDLPDHAPLLGKERLVPLGFFRRGRVLPDIRVTNEAGERTPTLIARENRDLTRKMLRLLGGRDKPPSDKQIIALTEETPEKGAAVREELLASLGDDSRGRCLKQLVADIAQGFILFAILPEPNRRRALTVSYEERLERVKWRQGGKIKETWPKEVVQWLPRRRCPDNPRGLMAKFAATVGWSPCHIAWLQWSVGDVASSHVEIVAPAELEATAARLTVVRRKGGPETFAADDVGPRATLYARAKRMDKNRLPWVRGKPALVSVLLRPRSANLLIAGLVTAVVTAGALGLGAFVPKALDSLAGAGGGAAPLLVAVPTLAAAFLSRPGEHAFAAVLLYGPRLLIATVGLLAFVAAGTLFFAGCNKYGSSCHAAHRLDWIWDVGAIWAAIVAFILTVAWLRVRSPVAPERGSVENKASRDLPPPRLIILNSEGKRCEEHIDAADLKWLASEFPAPGKRVG